jgi:hypothetical protein
MRSRTSSLRTQALPGRGAANLGGAFEYFLGGGGAPYGCFCDGGGPSS